MMKGCFDVKTAMFTRARSRAFTFIEIMLVVTIIGVLMAVVVPRMTNRAKGAKIQAAKATIHNTKSALQMFEVKAGRFPTTEEGMGALVTKPSDLDDDEWDGPYMEEPPKDPWNQDLIYKSPGENNKDFDLISKGPDRQEGTDDDIGHPKERGGV
jgi:general secretion pathway protein G